MALDMRALYTIMLGADEEDENTKANENCLNQNFIILAQKLEELELRLSALENG